MSSQADSQVSPSLSLAPAMSQTHTTSHDANTTTATATATQRLVDPIDELRRADISFAAAVSLGEAISQGELSPRSPQASKASLASLPIAVSHGDEDRVNDEGAEQVIHIHEQTAEEKEQEQQEEEGQAQQQYSDDGAVEPELPASLSGGKADATTPSPQVSSYTSCVSLSAYKTSSKSYARRVAHVVALPSNKEDLRGVRALDVGQLHAEPLVPHTTTLPKVVVDTVDENAVRVRLQQDEAYKHANAELMAQQIQIQAAAQERKAKEKVRVQPPPVIAVKVTKKVRTAASAPTRSQSHPSHTAAEGAALRHPYYLPQIHERDGQPRRPPVPHTRRASPARLARLHTAPSALHNYNTNNNTNNSGNDDSAAVHHLQRIHSVNAKILRQRSLGLYGNLPHETLVRSCVVTPMRASIGTSTATSHATPLHSRRGSVGSAHEKRSLSSSIESGAHHRSSHSNHYYYYKYNYNYDGEDDKKPRPAASVPRTRSRTSSTGWYASRQPTPQRLTTTSMRSSSNGGGGGNYGAVGSRDVWQRPPLPFARTRTTLLAPFSYTATAQERRLNSPFVSPARQESGARMRAATPPPLPPSASVAQELNIDYLRAVTTTTYCGVTAGRATPQRRSDARPISTAAAAVSTLVSPERMSRSPARVRAAHGLAGASVPLPPAPSLRGSGRVLRRVTKWAPGAQTEEEEKRRAAGVDRAVQTESTGCHGGSVLWKKRWMTDTAAEAKEEGGEEQKEATSYKKTKNNNDDNNSYVRRASPVVHKAPSFVYLRSVSPAKLLSTWTDVNYLHEPIERAASHTEGNAAQTTSLRTPSPAPDKLASADNALLPSRSPQRNGRGRTPSAAPRPRRTPRQHVLRGSLPRSETSEAAHTIEAAQRNITPTAAVGVRAVPAVVAVPRAASVSYVSSSYTTQQPQPQPQAAAHTTATTNALQRQRTTTTTQDAKKKARTTRTTAVVVVASTLSELRPLSELPHTREQRQQQREGGGEHTEVGGQYRANEKDEDKEVRTTAVFRDGTAAAPVLSSERAWFEAPAAPMAAFHTDTTYHSYTNCVESDEAARLSELPLRPTTRFTGNEENEEVDNASVSVTISRLSSQRPTISETPHRLTSLSPPPAPERATLVPLPPQHTLTLGHNTSQETLEESGEAAVMKDKAQEAAMERTGDEAVAAATTTMPNDATHTFYTRETVSNTRLSAALQRLYGGHSPSPPPSSQPLEVQVEEQQQQTVSAAAAPEASHSMSSAQRGRVRAMLSSAIRLQEAEGQSNQAIHTLPAEHIMVNTGEEQYEMGDNAMAENTPNVTPQSATSAAFSSAVDVSASETGNAYLCADVKRGYAWQVPMRTQENDHNGNNNSNNGDTMPDISPAMQDGVR